MDEIEKGRQFKEEGFFVVAEVLSKDELTRTRNALNRRIQITRQIRASAHLAVLDQNDANIRINVLPAIDQVFIELLMQRDTLKSVDALLGSYFLISNFFANKVLLDSGSVRLHADQALVMPPPWLHAFAMNVLWCLDDVHDANGATHYLPGSHRYQLLEEVPADAMAKTVAFKAFAGSFIAMDGWLRHTSGRNVTKREQRRMLFSYYSSDFIRQEINWNVYLPAEIQDGLGEKARELFGLTPHGSTRIAMEMTTQIPTC